MKVYNECKTTIKELTNLTFQMNSEIESTINKLKLVFDFSNFVKPNH